MNVVCPIFTRISHPLSQGRVSDVLSNKNMNKENKITIKLEQGWDNISGVSEKARAGVKVLCDEKSLTIDSNGSRFDNKPQWMVLKKDDACFLARQILAFYAEETFKQQEGEVRKF